MKTDKAKKAGVCALALGMVFGLGGCGKGNGGYVARPLSDKAVNLANALTADGSVRTGESSAFTESNLSFATEFFKRSFEGENTLVSPLSLSIALSMTANGARAETLGEMEKTLGAPVSALNGGLSAYMEKLEGYSGEKIELSLADSIWMKEAEAVYVSEEFLQTNKNYYDAEIFSAPFDESTVSDINKWTENKTKGMIDKILEEIPDDVFMYLVNALYFAGEWETVYEEYQIADGSFTASDGIVSEAKMMSSAERVYLSDENTTGFIKNYAGGKLAFAALLPSEDITLDEYVGTMSAAKWKNLFSSRKGADVVARLPAFAYEFSVSAGDILRAMGMTSAFDEGAADFSGLYSRPGYNAYIGAVLHKTRIEVSETGTKAAAVTRVDMATESAGAPGDLYYVTLDRPFVYAIVDTESCYPLFLGAVTKLSE